MECGTGIQMANMVIKSVGIFVKASEHWAAFMHWHAGIDRHTRSSLIPFLCYYEHTTHLHAWETNSGKNYFQFE